MRVALSACEGKLKVQLCSYQESPWMSSLRGKVRCGAEPLEGPQVRRAALLARVTARSSALAGLDDLDRKKREVALAAVTANGIALQWERFKNDKEVVLAAVANSGQALKYVGKAARWQ
ncbi:Serine/threonine-protein kinase Nek1 [Durusdinium trenchii]|uniref:Serine/threonine-protein kinase Nek1 n=1 Tax=Durusdinium trenchii TaxID=1381693 RepID=A0ABP0SAM3_9DINO